MKITKKVLVAILTLAILATGFAVTAFAANEPAADETNEANTAATESESFIAAVNAARGPLTYFALVEALESAASHIAGADFGYPGVQEAYDAYVSLLEKVNSNYQRELAEELLFHVNKHYYFNEDFSEATDSKGTPAFSTQQYPEFKFALNGTAGTFGATFKIVKNTYGEYVNISLNNPSNFNFIPDEVGSFSLKLRSAITNDKSALNLFLLGEGEKKTQILKIEKESVSVYDSGTKSLVANTSSITKSTASAPKFSDVDIIYRVEGENATLYVVVTTDSEKTTYVSEINVTEFTGFQLTVNKVCLDSMQAYAGGKMGVSTPEVIAMTINKLVEFYNAAPNADYANEILSAIADAVTIHGYDYNTVTDAQLKTKTEASVLSALGIAANNYAESFINAVNSINKSSAYNDRLNYVNNLAKLKEILSIVRTNYISVQISASAASIDAANAAYDAEVAELAKIAVDTKLSYEAVSEVPDVLVATYAQLREAYDVLSLHPMCATFYDDTLSRAEVERVYALAVAIIAEYEKENAKAESFVNGVLGSNNEDVTDDETPEQFRSRYDNYVTAKANYYTDETCKAYLEEKYGITLEQIYEIYDAVNEEMVEIIDFAESFLMAVNEANITLSYSVKNSILEAWKNERANVELGYPGVSEAMALYSALEQNVKDKRDATKAYIEAVLAIESASDKQAAILYAKSLAAVGGDVSVDVTVMNSDNVEIDVAAANIILSGFEGDVLVDVLRNKNFVDAVNSIASANGYAAKHDAIVNALAMQSRADADNADVVAAVAKLNAAIADYNSGVNAANAAMEEAVNLAVTVTAQVAPTKSMAQVVAIIKKFYE